MATNTMHDSEPDPFAVKQLVKVQGGLRNSGSNISVLIS